MTWISHNHRPPTHAKQKNTITSAILVMMIENIKKDHKQRSNTMGSAKDTTVKPVLSGHSKIEKKKVLKTNGSLMKVKTIAECSLGAFCNTFDLH